MQSEAFRQSLIESFESQSLKIQERFGELVRKQLMWQPEFDKWSVGQCLYHIWLANEKYLKFLGYTVRHSPIHISPTAPYKSSWLGNRFIHAVGPRGFAGKVPKAIVPIYDNVPVEIAKLLAEQFIAIGVLLEDCKGKDLQRIKIPSPFIPFIRFQTGDALKAIEQHNERHIAQATRVMKLGRFPSLQPTVVSTGGITTQSVKKDSSSLH